MPIVFTALGNSLDATVVDGNFDALRGYLLEQVVNGDLNTEAINRYKIRNYSNGRIKSAIIRAEEVLDYEQGKYEQQHSFHEITYREHDSVIATGNLLTRHTMELLGRPGPSFYWQFQEDGIVYAGAPDPMRYHPGYCYSLWLTVPYTGLKLYVPEKCIVRMHGRAYYFGNVSAVADYIANGPGQAAWNAGFQGAAGKSIAMRLGLFVDENPNLTNEWLNTNPNILDPVTGAQAANVSWFQVAGKTVYSPLWQRECISGETVLQGGKWYNFSMKYRGAGALGYRVGGADPFVDGIFEYDSAPLPAGVGPYQAMIGVPPFEMQWISVSLHLEFLYGYNQIFDDTADITPIA